MSAQYNELSGRSVDRLQTLADGVFAIAMTLLVLDLRLPETDGVDNHELWSQLTGLGPQFAAYLLSFTMLGTFWLAQHTMLDRCTRSDRTLAWTCTVEHRGAGRRPAVLRGLATAAVPYLSGAPVA